MPCRSDYLEPTQREQELQRAAKLFVYVCEQTNVPVPAWAIREASSLYASDERSVTELCAALRAMDPAQREALVYNGRDPQARDLANWWEEHQAADAKREQAEAAEKERERLAQSGRDKLSPAERKALGIE